MVDKFIKSIFVQPPTILGNKLRHFSAYHITALSMVNSPFMIDEAEIEVLDLLLAIHICSFGFIDGPPSLFPEPDIKYLIEWGNRNKDFDLEAVIEEFREYVLDYIDSPEIWPDENQALKLSQIPSAFHAVSTVLQFMKGIDLVAAWDMPFSQLISYKCSIAEEKGWDIVNQSMVELKETLEAMTAEYDKPDADESEIVDQDKDHKDG